MHLSSKLYLSPYIINEGGINEIYVARSDVHFKFVHISPYYIISLDCTTFNGHDNSGIKEKHVLIASLPLKSKMWDISGNPPLLKFVSD